MSHRYHIECKIAADLYQKHDFSIIHAKKAYDRANQARVSFSTFLRLVKDGMLLAKGVRVFPVLD